ncbi:MAG: NifU family protein [Candidatus Omnitrophica bacterium]|nr:NifU family protein [Candidatus Omnitrophota bacterium]
MDQKLLDIVNKNIRPLLQRDGGDLQVVSLENNVLKISYKGSCGCCPHAAMGTLKFIEKILQEQYDPKIVVKMV